MKKTIFNLIAIITTAFFFNSCQKGENLDKDPNKPTAVTPDLVLNGVCNSIFEEPWGDEARWCQYNCCNYNYYGNQEYNWNNATLNYTTLKNVIKMEEEAVRVGYDKVNPYSALGKYFRALLYYKMTMLVGDLPLSEALSNSTFTPKYDSQKEIFVQVLKWLEEANSEMATLLTSGKASFSGDIYYNNDLSAWQRATNALQLRVLISLSSKVNDADLDIKNKFLNIISNPSVYPLFRNSADNMEFVYNNTFNKYPVNPDNFGFDATRYNMSATTLNTLADLNDPRAMFIAEPAGAKLKAGLQPTDYQAFFGAASSMDLADMSSKAGVDNGSAFLPGEFSFYNRKRFYSNYTAENTILIGFTEMCFNIAEAANRGWISENAKDWYEKGIKSAHDFYGIETGNIDVYFFKPGGKVTDGGSYNKFTIAFDQSVYLNQAKVAYAGNNAQGLSQILTQKYLGFFQNSGWEGYFNYRRTSVPAFSEGGPGTGNSAGANKIPVRFKYPASESSNNAANYNAAINSQFSGKDDINSLMWILK